MRRSNKKLHFFIQFALALSIIIIFSTGSAFAQTYTLTILKAGSGTGTVTSDVGGIDCGSTCQATFESGTVVTLTANPAGDSNFVAWSGDLTSTTNPDTITMDGDKTVTATFDLKQYTLTVNTAGTGSGTVDLSPPGGTYDHGTVVTLTANPAGD